MTRGVRSDGIRTLDDIRLRCWINDETGCWEWRFSFNDQGLPQAFISAGVFRPQRHVMYAHRAAFLLAGKLIRTGADVIYRKCGCRACVNPDHLRSGTRSDMNRASIARHGLSAGARANLVASHKKQCLPVETVTAISQAIERGELRKDICVRFGVHNDVVRKIARGDHIHQRGAVFRASSVFAIGAAA